MLDYINTPIFGVGISILAFTISSYIARRTKIMLLNPLLVGMIIVVGILLAFDIDYETYNLGGQMITFFLGPATVVLAVPLYKQRALLKGNLIPILVGIVVGSAAGIIFVVLAGRLLGLDRLLIASLVPRSTTTPIAMEISTLLDGNPALTAIFVSVMGISGYMFGEKLLKLFGVNHPIARGIAIGTTSHAVGTAKAMELGEVEGAMSSLAISVAGIVTVLMVPGVLWLLNII
ncbi:LrgB family protein [Gudongella sp. SC589]|jgi:predicted murein hydrolase (TIGR00659 family)|uniref:LrgB family protein n=1 Tax=Gudongella sp. SC589 TaxID=3385990 RepID=UPI003904DB80